MLSTSPRLSFYRLIHLLHPSIHLSCQHALYLMCTHHSFSIFFPSIHPLDMPVYTWRTNKIHIHHQSYICSLCLHLLSSSSCHLSSSSSYLTISSCCL